MLGETTVGDDVTTIPDSPGVRFCWCPPMEDPDDPDQHEAACAHTAFVEQLKATQSVPLVTPFRRPVMTSACYQASFGWVHVKPGCHCTR